MAHSIRLQIDSSAGVGEVLATFGDAAYWQARLASFSNGTATLDALKVEPNNTVTVAITVRLLSDRLPKVITQLRSGELVLKRSERWSRVDDGRVHGEITANVSGAPFSMAGQALISPLETGSRLDYNASVDVRIPLLGSRIESYVAGQASKEIGAIHRFTGDWLAKNC